ncbi:MAG: DUF4830 domain-containing protein [Clostridium sp.]|nr:DUF4830 domain-containing protein [Clostridium sp.]
MKMFTLRLKPKTLFGIILAVTGVVVILLTFVTNHVKTESKSVSAIVSASTDIERRDYLATFGWSADENFDTKELTIPQEWNDVYSNYNEIQLNQGFDLTEYKGKKVTLYTYKINNYKDISEGIVADMLVCDGNLIGGDICNISADDGFLVGFDGK